ENSILILVSNSGNSVVPVEVALEAKRRGAKVIALTSVKYSQSLPVANPFNKKLYEVADVVIDNKMPPGDAVIEVEGTSRKVAPVSTIINSFILQSLVATIVDKMLSKGTMPAVWLSAHLPGAEETNKWIIEKYFEKIKPL
ncbi:MAG: sugar isomerase domain-containing protein, partial [Nitrososphaeria archaeon]